jgi:hypothetical protein
MRCVRVFRLLLSFLYFVCELHDIRTSLRLSVKNLHSRFVGFHCNYMSLEGSICESFTV